MELQMGMPELMTLRDFLEHYHVGKTTFYKEVAAGRLPASTAARRLLNTAQHKT